MLLAQSHSTKIWRRIGPSQPPATVSHCPRIPASCDPSTALLDIESVARYRARGSRTRERQGPCPRSRSWYVAQPDLEPECPHPGYFMPVGVWRGFS